MKLLEKFGFHFRGLLQCWFFMTAMRDDFEVFGFRLPSVFRYIVNPQISMNFLVLLSKGQFLVV